MKKEIQINLNGIKSTEELFKLFRDSLSYGEDYPMPKSWDSLEDEIIDLNYGEDVKEINLKLTNFESLEKEIGKQESQILIYILALCTDSNQRVDGINFTFQIRLGEN